MSEKIITSWNVNSLNVREAHLADYLRQYPCDVIGLQEIKQSDDAVRREPYGDLGFHLETHGQKTYNGVALLSREPMQDIVRGIPGLDDTQARAIAATICGIRVINLYVPNGKAVGDEKYAYKLDWLAHLANWLDDELARHAALVVMGDFNIAPEDIDVHDPAAWQDKILCSVPEREALQRLLGLGLRDAYRSVHPDSQQFSWWDYRMNGFRRNLGLRIDLNLVSAGLDIVDAGIHADVRAWERPSDHAPAWVAVKKADVL
ncbi:MAG: exodeoxyribonuclease III [Cardiobacteriaceae bacterium]|nr:exodeoxyribonuclease III [Cardiobacteriaceae bacterium]